MFQMKEQEEKPNEIDNLPGKYLQTLLTKMLVDLGERTDKHKNLNKELENIKKNQSELKNTVVKMKNTLEDINSRLGDIEEHKENLEDRQNSGNDPTRIMIHHNQN